MKEKLYIVTIFCFILNINLPAQKGYAERINQLNEKGQKTGLWKEDANKHWRTEIYYQNGKKNGLYKSFSIPKGELSYFGEYRNDTISGTWYYFGDFGHLIMVQKNFKKNDKKFSIKNRAQSIPPFQCYCVIYHPNGIKASEGILLWEDDPESDTAFEYGEWKYYTDTGALTKTKIFK